VRRLLASDNIWLRVGTLAGLIEARAPGIDALLVRVLEGHPSALVADQAAMGQRILRPSQDKTAN
jgi:hypothetical protein